MPSLALIQPQTLRPTINVKPWDTVGLNLDHLDPFPETISVHLGAAFLGQ